MKLRKMAAGILAAAMAVVSIPQVVSAESSEPEFGVGDTFYVNYDGSTGAVDGVPKSSQYVIPNSYICTILDDETISAGMSMSPASYNYRGNKITIPDTIAGYTVTQISEIDWQCAFASITIPDTVTTINKSAFSHHLLLEEIKFGANSQLKLIDQWAFQDCRSLKSITIPASVETIASSAFFNSGNDLVVGGINIETIDFTNVYSLETVKFAEGSKLKLIDQWAFQDQKNLKSITLPDSLEKIGYGAFLNCTSLTKIDIPENVNEIGAGAFSAQGDAVMSISEINVDSNNKDFKSIDGVVFSKNGKTIIVYPSGKSGDYTIPSDVNKIAEIAFGHSTKLTSVTIPEGVTVIPENAFTYCTSLAEVTLPSTLKSIDKWGFEATAFTSIYIPASVTSIDPHAFDSAALKTINGVEGSYAETYAKQNGYAFNGIPNPDVPDDSSTFTDGSGDTGIEVIDNNGAIPKEAVFSVRIDDEHSSDTRIAYDCSFTYNGAEYEPTETVTVRIPVPIAMRDIAETLKVYHLQDGKYVPMTVKYEDGYLVFETDHFSIYVVTPDVISNDDDNTGDDTTASDPAPAVPTIPSGNFQVPETTTAAATTTEAAPVATEAAYNSTANTAAAATTTTTTAAVAAPADTNGSSGDTAQPVVSEDNGSDNSTADNGASAVGNDGAANDKGENPDTGSAIAIVPVIVAAAAVSFIAYKRKK